MADFGVYRDLQRHRMLTQERQILGCHLGYTIAQEIIDAGLKEPYEEALLRAKEAWSQIEKIMPIEAQYIVPMAYRIRWYYHINLRSLQWLCELRSSAAGHTEYRFVAQELARLTCEAHPQFKSLFGFVDYSGHSMGRLDQEHRRVEKQQDHANVRS
jgi:thymidylate synthase ThyX